MGGFCNGFEITFVSEKHVVEDYILFTNHLVGNRKLQQRSWSATIPHREDMVQAGCDYLNPVLTSCCA